MGVVINDHGLFIISEKAVELATFGQVPDCFYGLVDLGRGGGLCKRCQYMHLFFDFGTAQGVAWVGFTFSHRMATQATPSAVPKSKKRCMHLRLLHRPSPPPTPPRP